MAMSLPFGIGQAPKSATEIKMKMEELEHRMLAQQRATDIAQITNSDMVYRRSVYPTVSVDSTDVYTGRPTPEQMLAMRMRWSPMERYPLDHISMYIAKDKAFIFVVKDGSHVTIEDDAALFPSDALITQLRLLVG